jgi:hypothetical protein
MSAAKSTSSTVPGNGRLTARETAAAIGTNLGGVLRLHSDPLFPRRGIAGSYDKAGVLGWIKNRDSQTSTPTAPPTITANPPRDRRVTDRRSPHV